MNHQFSRVLARKLSFRKTVFRDLLKQGEHFTDPLKVLIWYKIKKIPFVAVYKDRMENNTMSVTGAFCAEEAAWNCPKDQQSFFLLSLCLFLSVHLV
jgi:hypothetical protein